MKLKKFNSYRVSLLKIIRTTQLGHILSATYSFSERGVIASSRIYLKSLIVLIRHRETQNWNNCNRRYSMLGIPC